MTDQPEQAQIETIRRGIPGTIWHEGKDWQGYLQTPVTTDAVKAAMGALNALAARLRQAEQALERVAEQQPKTLAMIEANGFVFDSIGHEPGNWQHLAFTVYTDLCEVDSVARAALDAVKEQS